MRWGMVALALLCLLSLCACAEEEWQEATVVNCQEWVSLREAPGTSAERLTTVPLGATVKARRYDEEFAECEYQDMHGYILIDYLDLPQQGGAQEMAAGSGTLVPNVAEYLSLRASASASASVVARVGPGSAMTVLGWSGGFAKVRVDATGAVGYVHTAYVQAADGDLSRWPYDYDALLQDVTALQALGVECESIGRSLDGRELLALTFGTGDRHILIQADIHGREGMTGRLVVDLLMQLAQDHPGGIEGVTFHVIPMSNPDGVTIAVHGPDGLSDPSLAAMVQQLLAAEGESFSRWKANARGVDLNRNFPTGWERLTGRTPGSSRYRGEQPLSEPESAALAEYFRSRRFAATVSYHSYGSLIYWQGAEGGLSARAESLARAIGDATGYPLVRNELSTVERGGFKDWALMNCAVPSVTEEIGALDSSGSIQEYTCLLLRHTGSWEVLADWVLAQQ